MESMLYFREYSRARNLLYIGARRREAIKSLSIGAYMTNLPFICPTSRRKEQKMNFDLPRKASMLSTLVKRLHAFIRRIFSHYERDVVVV